MTYDLFLGDRLYSSWSMRGWLMFEKFQIPHRVHMVGLYSGTMSEDLSPVAPARLVPAIRTPNGVAVGESIAIAETLAERHPDAGFWPSDPAQRATARWLCAEMASGFSALRGDCPMQLRHQKRGFSPSPAVRADLARVQTLWDHARAMATEQGPWLFGSYSLADVFFAPVAARIAGYDLPVGAAGRAYVSAHLTDPAFLKWRDSALGEAGDIDPYPSDLATAPWPGSGES